MQHVSRRLSDIKPGRTLELAEVRPAEGVKGRKPTALLITAVSAYRTSVEVTGMKLNRAGKAHPSGKLHTEDVVKDTFRVVWEDVELAASEETVAVEEESETQTEAPHGL